MNIDQIKGKYFFCKDIPAWRMDRIIAALQLLGMEHGESYFEHGVWRAFKWHENFNSAWYNDVPAAETSTTIDEVEAIAFRLLAERAPGWASFIGVEENGGTYLFEEEPAPLFGGSFKQFKRGVLGGRSRHEPIRDKPEVTLRTGADLIKIDLRPYKGNQQENSTMFNVGDKVVINGFRADGSDFFYGTNPTIECWESEKKILQVKRIDGPDAFVCGPDDGIMSSFHPSELRIALESEVAAASAPEIHKGTVVKHKASGDVFIINRETPDSDGDLHATPITNEHGRYIRESRLDEYRILGRVMPDGDFRPVE